MKRTFVLTISNRKGGTGKTTSSVNLAAEIAFRGFRTLLIDMDTQSHASIGLGFGILPKGTPSIHDIFSSPEKIDLLAAVKETAFENLFFLPADTNFEGFAVQRQLRLLHDYLNQPEFQERFDFIVLDTPPSLDIVLMNSVAAANGILIPLVPHHLASEGVKQLARLFYKIASTVNPDLKLLGLVPIMVDKRMNMHKTVIENISLQYGNDRLFRGIRTDIHLAESFAAGKPVRYAFPKTRGALDYHLLTDEILQLWKVAEFIN